MRPCRRPSSRREDGGNTAVRHQREGGTSYFDEVNLIVKGWHSVTTALDGSTEEAQFAD